MSSGRRLFLTFNLSGQVGNTCDSCLYCTAHIWGWENKTNCKQTETLTFFIIQCLFQTLVLFCKQLPPRRTDRHLIIKSTASSFSTLLLLCFDLMEFPSFWFFLKLFFLFQRRKKKKKKKGLTCSINNKKEFFFPHVSFRVLCYAEMFVSGEWIHMFLTPVTAPLFRKHSWPIITAEFV